MPTKEVYTVWKERKGVWKVQLKKHIETFSTKKRAKEFADKWKRAGKGEQVFMS